MKIEEMIDRRCMDCKHVIVACEEYAYYGGVTQKEYYLDGCRKDLVPHYDDEEECIECEGYERRPDYDE